MAYLSLNDFLDYQDISSSSDDALISVLLTAAQQAIDTYCQRTFEGEAEDRKFDAVSDVEGRTLYVYSAGDLASISSITNGDGNTVASSEYVTEPRHATDKGVPIYAIKLKMGSSVYWRSANGVPEDAITVNGVWAYSATPPADIVQATRRLTAYYYDSKESIDDTVSVIPGQTVSIPLGMPNSVKQLLNPYVRPL